MNLINFISNLLGIKVFPDVLPHPDPEDGNSLDLTGYRQIPNYICGAVAGWMVVEYLYPNRSFNRFYNRCSPNEENGTPSRRLENALRETGISVRIPGRLTFRRLRQAIDEECPVIARLYLEDEDITHWVVVYGYDWRSNLVYAANYGGWWVFGDHNLPWKEFHRMLYSRVLVCSQPLR